MSLAYAQGIFGRDDETVAFTFDKLTNKPLTRPVRVIAGGQEPKF